MAGSALAALLGIGCGGSTGHEDLPNVTPTSAGDSSVEAVTVVDATADTPSDADANADAGVDSTVNYLDGGGAFDVGILYADRALPDVVAPPSSTAGEGGAEAGSPWPDCPSFLLDCRHNLAIPAEFAPDGAVVPAENGSACATYPWFYNLQVDQCLGINSVQATDVDGATVAALPPCNWCIGAGPALRGSRAGDQRYSICMDLYTCVLKTNCFLGSGNNSGITSCLCGSEPSGMCASDPNPPGPCAQEEMDSLELNLGSASESAKAIGNYTDNFRCGGNLNQVLGGILQNDCYPDGSIHYSCLPLDAGGD
jgi:hypothetical protein